jgi:GTP-binding protein
VDHGKTPWVDAMLVAERHFRSNEQVAERVMDSMDLEREKRHHIHGQEYGRGLPGLVKINIVDTARPADFGWRGRADLNMVEGVMLCWWTLRRAAAPDPVRAVKSLAKKPAVIAVINKVDDGRTGASTKWSTSCTTC